MCGRYSILRSRREHEKFFNAVISEGMGFFQKYNAAPGLKLPVVLQTNSSREITLMQWGHVPGWAKDTRQKPKINTRSETLMQPDHQNILQNNRCIIPASGFYEWDSKTQGRTPYYFYSSQEDFLSLAGIWEFVQHPTGEVIRSFTIVTVQADDTVGKIHNRMPVILNREQVEPWLDPLTDITILSSLVKPGNRHLSSHPVDDAMNNPRFDDPACIVETQPRQPCML